MMQVNLDINMKDLFWDLLSLLRLKTVSDRYQIWSNIDWSKREDHSIHNNKFGTDILCIPNGVASLVM